ncbi:PLP-dependent transferase, partial [Candidatus Poribacteria bacterium]|nr:PLP-dependent transferase [Candidatus Poribacteria bacterium]
DIVIHSATKYLSGHSDVVSGAIMLSDENTYKKLKYYQNAIGALPSPFDCYFRTHDFPIKVAGKIAKNDLIINFTTWLIK